jgi:multicomponent Na+:H+ antiporter subunit D
MRLAMAMAALVCVGIGVAPGLLYATLPHAMDYAPYTTPHVINQLQLLLLASMAFTLLIRTGLYPPEIRSVNLDTDTIYRRTLPSAWHALTQIPPRLRQRLRTPRHQTEKLWKSTTDPLRSNGSLVALWSTHLMVWWVTVLIGIVLLLSLL